MLNRSDKEKLVKDLEQEISDAQAVVFSNFDQLLVTDLMCLRKKLHIPGISLRVIKSKLVQKALEKLNFKLDSEFVKKPMIVALTNNDDVSLVKELVNFAKDNENFAPVSALFENKIISQDEIKIIASLPSKDQLLAKLVGSIKAPVSNLIWSLKYNQVGLINILKQIKK
ncbi:MAG: 50S ribosomal protein L10 [Berkelbacteria bacterium GW2011_GWA2_35_9]|uniref:Large ribosomal subunit protein uL10 n=1 Tax=Berkelbacteria bacterium GW2011_GWA2_35_9 TaxID=1618333 RepID=A0A0G0D4N7_9BACT|nr:MAG: 50S ribosomal protein L10 [Berkelbacteria bacterium GW2011_GWA2_35_9]